MGQGTCFLTPKLWAQGPSHPLSDLHWLSFPGCHRGSPLQIVVSLVTEPHRIKADRNSAACKALSNTEGDGCGKLLWLRCITQTDKQLALPCVLSPASGTAVIVDTSSITSVLFPTLFIQGKMWYPNTIPLPCLVLVTCMCGLRKSPGLIKLFLLLHKALLLGALDMYWNSGCLKLALWLWVKPLLWGYLLGICVVSLSLFSPTLLTFQHYWAIYLCNSFLIWALNHNLYWNRDKWYKRVNTGYSQTKLATLVQTFFPFLAHPVSPFLHTQILSLNLPFPSYTSVNSYLIATVTQAFNTWNICPETEEGESEHFELEWVCSGWISLGRLGRENLS